MIWLGIALVLILGIAAITAAYKQRISRIAETDLAGINYFEDFFNSVNGTPYTSFTSGTGVVGQDQNAPDDRCSFVSASVVGSGSGTAKFYLPAAIHVASDTTTNLSTEMIVTALSNGTGQFSLCWGLSGSNDFLANLPVPRIIFTYQKGVSNNWIAQAVVNNGSLSTQSVVTTVPVSAQTYTRLKIIISGTTAYFFINAVIVATINNVFLSTMYVGAQTDYTTGTVAGGGSYDYNWLIQQFATPRQTP